jgi:ABC-2 type transport system permease protein
VRRIFHVARRDFIATVTTRAFILALTVPPLFYAAFGWFAPRMMNERVPATTGDLSVFDRDGEVIGGVRDYLRPDAILERRRAAMNRAVQSTMKSPGAVPAGSTALAAGLLDAPRIDVIETAASDLSRAKAALAAGDKRQIALVVIHPDSVRRSAAGSYGTYDLFVRANLDDRIQGEIRDALENSIVHARLHAAGLDPDDVEAMTTVRRARSVTITAEGEAETVPAFARILPFAFAILLLMSVMSSGQYLMTTTIEEKASRTMEVLLSAVTPLELMSGKILGQLAVGLLVLGLYSAVGLAVLFSLALLGLLNLSLLFYLFVFFLLTYLVFGSLMAAVGAAVNELREAQSLMMPLTMSMMVPWLFLFRISREPTSLFSTVISFVPPMNAMAMLARLTSTSPPPLWQVWLSIGVSVAAAGAALWFAAKIFKIGLLMHGRPPNFRTLLEWAYRA